VACFIFILFFAPSVQVLLVGEILCGIPWGVFQTLTTVYESEVCPANLRAYLTTYVNFCWVIGTILGQCVLRGFLNTGSNQWGLSNPICNAVDLANPHCHRGLPGARVPMVAYAKGSARKMPKRLSENYSSRKLPRIRTLTRPWP
jgi:MFS family permease